jgi:hypothetical protein
VASAIMLAPLAESFRAMEAESATSKATRM